MFSILTPKVSDISFFCLLLYFSFFISVCFCYFLNSFLFLKIHFYCYTFILCLCELNILIITLTIAIETTILILNLLEINKISSFHFVDSIETLDYSAFCLTLNIQIFSIYIFYNVLYISDFWRCVCINQAIIIQIYLLCCSSITLSCI